MAVTTQTIISVDLASVTVGDLASFASNLTALGVPADTVVTNNGSTFSLTAVANA